MPLAGLFVAIATTALSILIVVSVTGGFTIDVGPLHLSAHRLVPPLILAAAACALAAVTGRDRFRAATAGVYTRLDTHGLAIAVVLAAATAGVGVAFGTYAASGADAGGYIGQAELLQHGHLSFHEPLVQRATWPDAAWTFAPLGFRPGGQPGEIVPTYPPGLPAVMLAASRLAGEMGPFLVAPLFGAIGVLATYFLGARVHSPRSGIFAAALLATSPVWLFQIVQPMSDVPATALWTVALLAAVNGAAVTSGLASALALLIRPNLFPLVASIGFLLASPDGSSRRIDLRGRARPLLAFAMLASLGPVLLAATQWRLYGSPLASGHGAFAELFDVSNILPNVRDYVVRMWRGETPALIVSATSLVLIAMLRRRIAPVMPISNAIRLLLITAVPVLICYLPYGVFPDWSYLRFLLPVFPAAFITVGALATNACQRLPMTLRGSVLVLALVASCSVNVRIARREAAFDLHTYEARYRTAGRYLEAVLPREAVIVTSQESASAHHYTGLPVLRWDLLAADLDRAVETLSSLGRHPVLLVEDWEEPLLRARFPSSKLALLDWRSRAQFGTTTRVRYVDPADREEPASAGPKGPALQVDRLP